MPTAVRKGTKHPPRIYCSTRKVCCTRVGLVEDWGGWLSVLWVHGKGPLALGEPGTIAVYGYRRSGKSALLEALAAIHLESGWTVVDLYGGPGEQLSWLMSPYVEEEPDSLLFISDKHVLKCTGKYSQVTTASPSGLTRRDIESYKIVVVPTTLYETQQQQVESVSEMVSILYDTLSTRKPIYLFAREAYTLLYSRLKTIETAHTAKTLLVHIMNQARHVNILAAIDTIQLTSIDKLVRETTDITIYKRTPPQTLPPRLRKYIDTKMLEQSQPHQLVAYQQGEIAIGVFTQPPWHKQDTTTPIEILKRTGCTITIKT